MLGDRSEGDPGGADGPVVPPTTRQQLVAAQREDPELFPPLREAVKVEKAEGEATCYFPDNEVLKLKWRSP